jgi:two-component system response regulator HydG
MGVPQQIGLKGAKRGTWLERPVEAGGRMLGVVADSGQLTRLAVQAGADFLLALSAGVYRNRGISALAAFLPYRNSNDLTESLLRDGVMRSAGATPVVAGLMAVDPTGILGDRLDRLRRWGVAGLTNYPSVTLIDGVLRVVYESEGQTVEAEIALLAEARRRGMAAVGFVGADPATVARFAGAGVDALILTPGMTRELDDIPERRDRLQHAIRQLNAGLEAARRVAPRVPCLAFGGPFTTAEDIEQLYRQVRFDGFVGGSVFGRLPIESSVPAAIRRFKSIAIPAGGGDESQTGLGPMIGTTPVMRQLFRLIERAAACDLNVCIEGESGVGKELVATQIHCLSGRSHAALVTLNCGAIPDSLLESELFGHERGAFTGADRRRLGKFELAHNGTLFLDEIGDLSPHGQVALLRAIQQREITRVGGNASIPVDNRVLSATNQPLATLVAQGKFRTDLYYRLNHLTLVVPPLRDRLDEIPLLVRPILASLRIQMNRELIDLEPQFYDKLRSHAWPGNLRELQHVIYQAALLEDGPLLRGRQFTPSPFATTMKPASVGSVTGRIVAETQATRRRLICQALVDAGGNKSRAAALLGVSRKTLYAWIKEVELTDAR